MKTLLAVVAVAFCFYSFCYISDKDEPSPKSAYYIVVEDFTDNTAYKYLVESKDSADRIFDRFFASELSLGNVDHPITIYNLKHNFYIERVELFETKNGKTKVKHLKYDDIRGKRKQLDTTVF